MARVNIHGMAPDTIEELKAENPGIEFYDEAPAKVVAMPKRCAKVSDTRGGCTLEDGHAGDHAWELPLQTDLKEATDQLGATMTAAAAKLPEEEILAKDIEEVTGQPGPDSLQE